MSRIVRPASGGKPGKEGRHLRLAAPLYADGVARPKVAYLAQPVEAVFVAAAAKKLAKLSIETVGDLLYHFPRRYHQLGELTAYSDLVVGDYVTVYARIVHTTWRRTKAGMYLFNAIVTDGLRELDLTFFAKREHVVKHWERQFAPGRFGLFSGVVGVYQRRLQLTHPESNLLDRMMDADKLQATVAKPMPVYPAASGADSWFISECIKPVLGPLTEAETPDPLPPEILAREGYPSRFEAIHLLHEPATAADWPPARRRMRYEEAFLTQVALVRRRLEHAGLAATPRPVRDSGLLAAFDEALPFALTAGQREVGEQLAADLSQPHPMQRLLQGEVGSGKTVVALRAMLQVVDGGGQAALLAPTEVLAAQHLRSLRALLGPLAEEGLMAGDGPHVALRLLTGSLGAAARKQALLDVASGTAGIVIGTHALLSNPVQFADLGMVVIDEQHRFGVEQRDALRAKGDQPHVLVMTATPIPRTVAMTVFGDLETATLAELPSGRPGIATHLVPAGKPAWVARCWTRIREEVDAGGRAYVVCPAIARGEEATAETAPDGEAAQGGEGGRDKKKPKKPLVSVEAMVEQLRSEPALAGVGIAVLHGRMSAEEKDRAMADFISGHTPVLVSTTVIEVGVDVPEATVMVVLDADRFGLSQLHQLRGRVGRGTKAGLCLLVSATLDDDGEALLPDVTAKSSRARKRLEALAEMSDGFDLAEADLQLRREGDVLGSSQSGRSSLKTLRVIDDADLIRQARRDAQELLADDPDLSRHPKLVEVMGERLREREEFVEKN